MKIIDERTENLNLPLPCATNLLDQDLPRLRDSFNIIDESFATQAKQIDEKLAAAGTEADEKVKALKADVEQVLKSANEKTEALEAEVKDVAQAAAEPKWGDIAGVPTVFAPTNHVAKHRTGGGDALTPADIGALPSGGNAASAARLATARTITLSGAVTGAANFDGSKNIVISTVIANTGFLKAQNIPSGSGNVISNASLSVSGNTISLNFTRSTVTTNCASSNCTVVNNCNCTSNCDCTRN